MKECGKFIFLMLILYTRFTGKIAETQSEVLYSNSSWNVLPEHISLTEENINLVYNDSYVAIYFGSSLSTNLNWTFKPISEAWGYVKKTYGLFLPDNNFIPYFIFRYDTFSSFDGCFIHENIKFEAGILCTMHKIPYLDFRNELSSFWLDHFVPSIGSLLEIVIDKTANWKRTSWLGNWMDNIFVYDIFLKIGGTAGAKRFRENKSPNIIDRSNVFKRLFRDWHMPIYTDFGGANVLKKYRRNVYKYLPKERNYFVRETRVGDFLHFWSGSVGECLKDLAKKIIVWDPIYNDLWSKSREQYPYFNYSCSNYTDIKPDEKWKEHWEGHNQDLHLAFNDKNIAVYFDKEVNTSIVWPFQFLSRGWEYCKNTFGPLNRYPFLYIILHGSNSSCMYSHAGTLEDLNYENKNVIDCGPGDKVWDFESQENVNLLLKQSGRLVIATARSKEGSWPGYQSAGYSIVDIIAYDVHLHLGIREYANEWLEKMKKKLKTFLTQTLFGSEIGIIPFKIVTELRL